MICTDTPNRKCPICKQPMRFGTIHRHSGVTVEYSTVVQQKVTNAKPITLRFPGLIIKETKAHKEAKNG